MSPEERSKVDESVAKLLEHFDSVRIFVTSHNGENSRTGSYDSGGGNFYAQLGQINEWAAVQDAYTRQYAADKQQKTTDEDNQDPPSGTTGDNENP